METELQLTARGHAVCELMVDQGLTLEKACARIDAELESLRQTVERILSGNSWEAVPHAMQRALDSISLHVQAAYLEEERAHNEAPVPIPA
ncbi:MAG: hypothetical protein ABI488_17695 [Polyangiaceae bacterium]